MDINDLDMTAIEGTTKPKKKIKSHPHRDFGINLEAKGSGSFAFIVFFAVIGVIALTIVMTLGVMQLSTLLGV